MGKYDIGWCLVIFYTEIWFWIFFHNRIELKFLCGTWSFLHAICETNPKDFARVFFYVVKKNNSDFFFTHQSLSELYFWSKNSRTFSKRCRKIKTRAGYLVFTYIHVKKIHYTRKIWLENLICAFVHSFHSWKNPANQLFSSKISV